MSLSHTSARLQILFPPHYPSLKGVSKHQKYHNCYNIHEKLYYVNFIFTHLHPPYIGVCEYTLRCKTLLYRVEGVRHEAAISGTKTAST